MRSFLFWPWYEMAEPHTITPPTSCFPAVQPPPCVDNMRCSSLRECDGALFDFFLFFFVLVWCEMSLEFNFLNRQTLSHRAVNEQLQQPRRKKKIRKSVPAIWWRALRWDIAAHHVWMKLSQCGTITFAGGKLILTYSCLHLASSWTVWISNAGMSPIHLADRQP